MPHVQDHWSRQPHPRALIEQSYRLDEVIDAVLADRDVRADDLQPEIAPLLDVVQMLAQLRYRVRDIRM